MSKAEDLYQKVLMDHNRTPKNMGALDNPSAKAKAYNRLCGDEIEVSVSCDDQYLSELKWQGQGCALSRASASILTEVTKGKSLTEVRQLIEELRNSWSGSSVQDEREDNLELSALKGVVAFPGRIKCVSLAWEALEAALQEANS